MKTDNSEFNFSTSILTFYDLKIDLSTTIVKVIVTPDVVIEDRNEIKYVN